MRAGFPILSVAVAGAAALTPVPAVAQPALPDPGRPLADRLEVAFRACALQLTQPDHLTQKNAAELAKVGIKPGAVPPAEVSAMAGRLFGDAGIYASVAAPAAELWIAASATVPACKVTVANSGLSLTARYDWTTKLRKTTGWTYDRTRSGMSGNFMRDVLVLNQERPGAHMTVILDGPNIVVQDGKGIQMIMTVAIDTTKAP